MIRRRSTPLCPTCGFDGHWPAPHPAVCSDEFHDATRRAQRTPRRRAVLVDIAVAVSVYRRARRRGLSRRVAWYWARRSWSDLPGFRRDRGIDA